MKFLVIKINISVHSMVQVIEEKIVSQSYIAVEKTFRPRPDEEIYFEIGMDGLANY